MRPIDADVLKEKAYPFPCAIGVEYAVTLRAINDTPTIDAVPVVHGRWRINEKFADYECSVCGQGDIISPYFKRLKLNYCPNCGAKMDGGAEG